MERYVSALCIEIEKFGRPLTQAVLTDTLYFGGGTPSLLSAPQLEKILKTIHSKFDVELDSEITLELNPATVSLEKLSDFKSLGVNRASFGVQTFDDRSLKLLARGHDANDARNTFALLRKSGFENISFDLIAGLPHQTLAEWKLNLSEAMNLAPEHISLYILEIHEGTPLAEQVRSKRQPQPDEDLAGEMYEVMLDKLAANGFEQYEISNFSRSGFQSKHNSKYWRCEPVFAFGVSAHSFDGISKRSSNERNTVKYLELIESNRSPVVEVNDLSIEQLSGEFVFLRLRQTKGLNLHEYQKRFEIDLRTKFADEFERFSELDLIELTESHLKLTRKGRIFSNEVFAAFV